MKKFLCFFLTVMLVFVFVSCDADDIKAAGDLLGRGRENVFGIKPDMGKVDEVSGNVSQAVATDNSGAMVTKDASQSSVMANKTVQEQQDMLEAAGLSGTDKVATLDLSQAASIMDNISSISSSPQKTQELQNKLNTPVSEDAEELKAVSNAIKLEIASTSGAIKEKAASLTGNSKEVAEAVDGVVRTIMTAVPATPTQADIATVAIVNAVANKVVQAVSNAEAAGGMTNDTITQIAEEAFKALDALKVVTAVGSVDIVNDINLTNILTDVFEGLSRDLRAVVVRAEEEGELPKEEEIFELVERYASEMIIKILAEEVNGKALVTSASFNRAVMQFRAIRMQYDYVAKALIGYKEFSYVNEQKSGYFAEALNALKENKLNYSVSGATGIIASKLSLGQSVFDLNDFVLYIESFVFDIAARYVNEDFIATWVNYILDLSNTVPAGYEEDLKPEDILNANMFGALLDKIQAQDKQGAQEIANSLVDGEISYLLNEVYTFANTVVSMLIDIDFNTALKNILLMTTGGEINVGVGDGNIDIFDLLYDPENPVDTDSIINDNLDIWLSELSNMLKEGLFGVEQ